MASGFFRYCATAKLNTGQRQGLPDLSSSDEESSKPSIIELLSDEDEEEEAAFVPIPGSKRPDGSSPTVNKKGKTKANISSHSSSEGEEQEDDIEKFIVNDEEIEGDATGGGHGMMLPVNFSIRGAQPLAHSFKVFFQLLVHVAYQPENVRKEYMKARLEGAPHTTNPCVGQTSLGLTPILHRR